MTDSSQVQKLIEKGAEILNPNSVYIDPTVRLDRISNDVKIFPGCRIIGAETFIGQNCTVGQDAPVTIDNCQLASNVSLEGGTFAGATLLSGVSFGPSAHVRPATIMEEQSSCAHSVGLKQTFLMPFVTLGSLINFCDCFMAGGTNRKDHSEVGSSYIHFNYTPHQDKATASLIGDVPRGVMLDQSPIFLGGQGGLVGPTTIEYGAITAAGTICRKSITEAGKLVYEKTLPKRIELPYQPGAYGDISRVITNNLIYIGNLIAMLNWYQNVRSLFISDDYPQPCHDGAITNIEQMIEERTSRITQLAENMPRSIEIAEQKLGIDPTEPPFDKQKRLHEEWPKIASQMEANSFSADSESKTSFLSNFTAGPSYIDSIHSLDDNTKQVGTAWLQSIVNNTTNLWQH
jgi:bifunctional UDP-N-acetylglucosamine pyrophosphorylase/glucosamine-1-phosphate N-acetyltransferase